MSRETFGYMLSRMGCIMIAGSLLWLAAMLVGTYQLVSLGLIVVALYLLRMGLR